MGGGRCRCEAVQGAKTPGSEVDAEERPQNGPSNRLSTRAVSFNALPFHATHPHSKVVIPPRRYSIKMKNGKTTYHDRLLLTVLLDSMACNSTTVPPGPKVSHQRTLIRSCSHIMSVKRYVLLRYQKSPLTPTDFGWRLLINQ